MEGGWDILFGHTNYYKSNIIQLMNNKMLLHFYHKDHWDPGLFTRYILLYQLCWQLRIPTSSWVLLAINGYLIMIICIFVKYNKSLIFKGSFPDFFRFLSHPSQWTCDPRESHLDLATEKQNFWPEVKRQHQNNPQSCKSCSCGSGGVFHLAKLVCHKILVLDVLLMVWECQFHLK